jgi:uncharacterized membrane protein
VIRIEHAYWLLGALLATFTLLGLRDRANPKHVTTALFWGLLAFTFLGGDFVHPAVVGALVIVLALIVGFGGVGAAATARGADSNRTTQAERLGNRLFTPVLLIPLLTVAGVVLLPRLQIAGRALVAGNNATLISLVLACVIALIAALRLTGSRPLVAIDEGRRLLDAIGWAALLPPLLAMLGSVFDRAGVGAIVADLVTSALPVDIRFVAVLAYAGGMALFTMIMGNAFAAFPVMTAGIGLPILVGVHHADPAAMCALGMLSGYCGTLMTPMAANFNLVPAALLELRDPYGVIRAQAPTGVGVFVINLILMNLLLFR